MIETDGRGGRDHPVEILFRKLDGFRYPGGVVATWCLVEGPEFFPGGAGLWNAKPGEPWPPLRPGCTIVLGHNLDSINSYKKNLKTGGLMKGPTWSNLKKLLLAAGISFDEVFLTNFFMGVGSRQVGRFAGAADQQFVDDCLGLLAETIRLLRPRALLVLGANTRQHLVGLSPKLLQWAELRTFADLDSRRCALVQGVELPGVPPFSVANIVHPSGANMGGNQRDRDYQGRTGFHAEVALLQGATGTSALSFPTTEPEPGRPEVPCRTCAAEPKSDDQKGARQSPRMQAAGLSGFNTWRMNTDSNARLDRRTCDLWYELGIALAGDFAGREFDHAGVFRKLSKGDHIFMHHSRLGIVGYGEVLEDWNGAVYSGHDRLLYLKEIYEYRVPVAWRTDCDCRDSPLPIESRLPYMGPYSRVNPAKWDIEGVVDELRRRSGRNTGIACSDKLGRD